MLRYRNGTPDAFAAKVREHRGPRRVYWDGPRAPYAAMSTSHRGATASRVLVTGRERGWRAPSGKRAAGKPNTDVRVALGAGLDRRFFVTATKVDSLGGEARHPAGHPNAGQDGGQRPYAITEDK